jgi:hypothetical protein
VIRKARLLMKGRGEAAPALICCPIHRSAWKGNSANFAYTEFSEVQRLLGALMCFVLWRTYTALRKE